MVHLNPVMITLAMDRKEHHNMKVVDLPGAFLSVDKPDIV